MKTILKLIMLTCLFIFSSEVNAIEYYRVVNVEADDTLSVRAKPNAQSKKIARLYPYDTGLVIDKCKNLGSSTWCKIDFLSDNTFFYERGFHNGGWVNKHYLERANNILPNVSRTYRVAHVAPDDNLTVRKHPTRHSRILGNLKHNDRCIYALQCQQIDFHNNWCYVGYSYSHGGPEGNWKIAKLGWVNMKYLTPYNGSICNTPQNKFYDFVYPGETY